MRNILCSLIILLILSSCGKKEIKPVSEEARIAQEAFKLAEVIKNAYIKNDRITIQRNSTKDGYREIIEVMKSFDNAELTFSPRKVEIEDSTVYLNLTWSGIWSVKGKKIEDRGLTIFVMEGKPLRLSRVMRENPFKQPE
ncbi:MAG: hypothetical protein HXY47_04620 [Nitrospirae bacterium]|nr:hypothetical protein [Nitrospirota bacterium]